MKRFAPLVLLALTGCFSVQEQNLGKCKLAAQNKFPDEFGWYIGGGKQAYVELCMEAAGYRLNRFQSFCPHRYAIEDGAVFAECYVPMDSWEAFKTRVELWSRE